MEDSYEKNGIVFFNTPYEVKQMDWLYSHLDCDSIILRKDLDDKIIYVVCYAKSKEYNKDLYEVIKNSAKDYVYLRGLNSKGVNSIDSYRI